MLGKDFGLSKNKTNKKIGKKTKRPLSPGRMHKKLPNFKLKPPDKQPT
jgi:hypothetical protein